MTSSKAPKVQGRKPDSLSPPKTRRRRSADVDLREQLDEARRELREAREQQPTIGYLGSSTAVTQSQWTAAFTKRLRELGD